MPFKLIIKLLMDLFLCADLSANVHSRTQVAQSSIQQNGPHDGYVIQNVWKRQGVVLKRQQADKVVSVDTCIVWDDAVNGWRMVLFYDPPGHAQAVCLNLNREDQGQGQWKLEGSLPVANPQAVGGFHKPFIVMDPD